MTIYIDHGRVGSSPSLNRKWMAAAHAGVLDGSQRRQSPAAIALLKLLRLAHGERDGFLEGGFR